MVQGTIAFVCMSISSASRMSSSFLPSLSNSNASISRYSPMLHPPSMFHTTACPWAHPHATAQEDGPPNFFPPWSSFTVAVLEECNYRSELFGWSELSRHEHEFLMLVLHLKIILKLYVCVLRYIHVSMQVCMYACMHVCMYACMHVCIYIHMCACI